ncbi:ninein-like protein isoform X1 [Rana temporaria]|uniref:ninein-like protein isoform X1 n=2 Tax=Rana temporaria TaxID=8407 RepID=UPI001AAC7594|nr:ninein-like protein isoform X1 [Rana temporaria]
MDKEEKNKYVSQLQEVFTSCDTTGTGYLDKDELTGLCHKLHLDAQLPLLLQTLLGNDHFARVNFEEFKEGFVAVLSSTIDISISEDDDESSYLEPVIPDEVKPKFVKGNKKYGRRTRPEREAAENEANKHLQETHQGKNKKKSSLRRSSSLESVESLKSDEEAEIVKEPEIENFEAEGQLRAWNTGIYDSPRRTSDMTQNQVRDIWEELGVGHHGYLNQQELSTVCKNIGLEDLTEEELEDLFNKLDRDGDGRVSFLEFQVGLFSHTPIASTPLKHHRPCALYKLEDSSHKSPSLLSGFGGFHVFSKIDDGTGFGNPEQIMIIWEEEGIEDGKEIFLSLDFSPEERVNLLELTAALENELLATKNRIHMAALASYKHELHHQHNQVEQISKERDKAKQDLESAERRNSLLVDEVDDHNSVMESLNESKIKDLEQEYRQRLSSMRSELENEKEQFLQQNDQQKKKLETDLANYQMEQAYFRHKLDLSLKENSRLQKEMLEVVGKLSESDSQLVKLQTSLDQMLQNKKLMDPHNTEFYTQEEKFAEIIREYEIQCRELRDHNDELQIQLETLRSQLSESKYSRLLGKMKDNKLLHHKAKEKIHQSHADTPAKRGLASRLRRSVSAAGSNGLSIVMSEAPSMTMEAELTKHQVKELQQEIEDLKIQLETKVNYYERELELMKVNFEKERKDSEQNFKLEISELEEQKADLEELNAKYQEVIDGLKEQLPKTAQIQEMKKFEKERAAMEEYYAKEVSALGQRLCREKEQLEEELKRSHQHELQSMREEAEEELAEKLAQIESQYTEYCQSLIQQHLNENDELLQKLELEKKALIQDHMDEINRWQEKERAQWKGDQMNPVEKPSEEQAGICKTFAIEKEILERNYRDHINRLNHEIEGLNALVLKAKSSNLIKKEKQSLVNRLGDHCTKGNEGPHLFSLQEESTEPEHQMMDNTNKQHNENVWHQSDSAPLHVQHRLVLSAVEVLKGEQSLKQAQEHVLMILQEMVRLVASLRAQLHKETKAQETLVVHQKGYGEDQIHLSNQFKKREDECMLAKDKSKDLTFQLLEGESPVKNLESALQMLGREEEELEKQVAVLAGHIGLEYKLMRNKIQEQGGDCAPKNECRYLIANVKELVDDNPSLCQQLLSKDDILNLLLGHLRKAMSQCQQLEQLTAKQIQESTDQLEREKDYVKGRLFQLEDLVRRLEQETISNQDDRMELTRLSEDNAFLRNKAERLQQDIIHLDDSNKKYRTQVEELRKETEYLHSELKQLSKQYQDHQNELSQSNVQHDETVLHLNTKLQEVTEQKDKADAVLEQLQGMNIAQETETHEQQVVWQREKEELEQELQKTKQENEKYWDELCQLNTHSLQLTSTLSDLTTQREGSYETIQQMNTKLREAIEEKHQTSALVEQLQGKMNELKRENLQNEAGWQREKIQLESELQMSKQESFETRNELCHLTSAMFQLKMQNKDGQENMQHLESRLKEVTKQKEEATATAEKVQNQLHLVEIEKAGWCQARERLEQDLQTSKTKIEALLLQHRQEKQDLLNGLDESNKQLLVVATFQEEVSTLKQEKRSLEEQCHSITRLLKEATDKVNQAEELKTELKEAREDCHNLKKTQDELREKLEVSQDQLLEANSKLTLAQSQQIREVQQWKEKVSSYVPKEQLSHLQSRLSEEQQKVQQLQERLRFHAEQTNRQLAMQQEEHERLLRRMEERMQEVEMNLKNLRLMLREKVDQLKEQLEKNAKADILLKDLYVENSQLMKALQVTEQRQKSVEKKNYVLEEKIAALNKVIRKIAPASLAV